MKSKPVRKYVPPKYPTRLEIAARPALLHRHQPPAWRKWPELTGAAALFLLADNARLAAADGPTNRSQNPSQPKAVAMVAPIFQHGEGRGATGCIVMSPPVFLSEEEALQVIRDEMASQGVQLGTNKVEVAGVTIERFDLKTGTFVRETFKAPAADRKKKVFVEFVSERNATSWDLARIREDGYAPSVSTVRDLDLLRTAAYAADCVKRQATNQVYFGTFYDPTTGNMDFDRKTVPKPVTAEAVPRTKQWVNPKGESRHLLRLQVQDFLKWLQAQGAI
jgi:hypothetical protein